MDDSTVRIRTWACGSADDVRSGLLGYVCVDYGDLVLDGIAVRRTAGGRLTVSFPARTDRGGRRHPYFRPADDDLRSKIEREILRQLGHARRVGLRDGGRR